MLLATMAQELAANGYTVLPPGSHPTEVVVDEGFVIYWFVSPPGLVFQTPEQALNWAQAATPPHDRASLEVDDISADGRATIRWYRRRTDADTLTTP